MLMYVYRTSVMYVNYIILHLKHLLMLNTGKTEYLAYTA
jgi:hypothetical protein